MVDAEPLGDTVDVVEERADLGGIGDRAVVPPGVPQTLHVLGAALRGRACQLVGILEQCQGRGIQSRSSPVLGEPIGQAFVVDLRPEIVQMGANSVVAFVRHRRHDRDHLALLP